jgi:hypothetical protein
MTVEYTCLAVFGRLGISAGKPGFLTEGAFSIPLAVLGNSRALTGAHPD